MKFCRLRRGRGALYRYGQNGDGAGGNDNFKGINAVKIALTVNGLTVEAHYHDDEIEKVHKPLLQQLAKIHAAAKTRAPYHQSFLARRPAQANPR